MNRSEIKNDLDNFIAEYCSQLLAEAKKEDKPIEIDVQALDRFQPDLVDKLQSDPDKILPILQDILENESVDNFLLVNLPEYFKKRIRDLRAENINTLIVTKGMIKRVSKVRPKLKSAKFECRSCGKRMEKEQSGSKVKSPYKCKCGSRKFSLEEKNFSNVQSVLIEEPPHTLQGSEQPISISTLLSGSLVEPNFQKNISPGNEVLMVGVLRSTSGDKKSAKYDYFLDVQNLIPTEIEFEEIEIEEEDEERIKEIKEEGNVLSTFKNAIASSIYGMDEVKKSLALQLFGGVKRTKQDGSEVRGDIHILLIGEPGTGKSMLVRYMSDLTPKGRFMSGGSATTTGATASVVKDEDGNWAVEAGAIVMADKGMLCLDELDLLEAKDLKKLNEALETQQLSINKATVNATLSTETSLLASGNPKYDRFDPFEPVAEQIEILPSLLSRFDLLFPIRDIPDEDRDSEVADHILGDAVSSVDVSRDIIRKYVSYARGIDPEHTEESKSRLKDFYVDLRNTYSSVEENQGQSPIPITARELESLMRLSEASARMRLSEEVEEKDVERVIDIMKYYLKKVGMDPDTGKYDIDMARSRTSTSKRNKMRSVMKIVKGLMKDYDGEAVPTEDVIAEAESAGISEVEPIIEKLKTKGDLFEPQRGKIKKT